MGPNSKPFSRADKLRIVRLQQLGCIVTLTNFKNLDGDYYDATPGDIHHILNESGQRYEDEHQYTICLTPWYHRGQPPIGPDGHALTCAAARALFGPSLAREKRAFEERFGTELELLLASNRLLIAMYGLGAATTRIPGLGAAWPSAEA